MFSKFFFMVVREIVLLPALPLYFSWEPFALTIGAFLSLFIIISFVAPVFIRIWGSSGSNSGGSAGKRRAWLFESTWLFGTYFSWVVLCNGGIDVKFNRHRIAIFLPPLATIGTFYFFTDSLPLLS